MLAVLEGGEQVLLLVEIVLPEALESGYEMGDIFHWARGGGRIFSKASPATPLAIMSKVLPESVP
ncbi:hypothetical protein GURASL_18150 [Geotalea uraniireducens]|uniref:Uncharacterized protein n=1 Tax=Geotalea uraniireducens TaxID=351604 RepID=A0ABN6VTW7_9BACT|nr:hypothetical protein GURASL_18150 [Geotalea uraniireducens]